MCADPRKPINEPTPSRYLTELVWQKFHAVRKKQVADPARARLSRDLSVQGARRSPPPPPRSSAPGRRPSRGCTLVWRQRENRSFNFGAQLTPEGLSLGDPSARRDREPGTLLASSEGLLGASATWPQGSVRDWMRSDKATRGGFRHESGPWPCGRRKKPPA